MRVRTSTVVAVPRVFFAVRMSESESGSASGATSAGPAADGVDGDTTCVSPNQGSSRCELAVYIFIV